MTDDKGKEPEKSGDSVKLKGKVVISTDRGHRTEIEDPEVRQVKIK